MFLTRHMQRGERLEVERQTEKFDSEAMSYLSYILYPLVVAGAVYQLVYSSYKRYVPHLGYNTSRVPSSSISRLALCTTILSARELTCSPPQLVLLGHTQSSQW